MNTKPLAFLCFLSVLCTSGCEGDFYRSSSHAVPEEAAAVSSLKQFTENISWNSNGNVVSIDLSHGEVSDQHLSLIVQLTKLQTLGLAGTRITDDGVAQLTELAHLKALSLAWTDITDEGVKKLGNLATLRSIDLSHTAITDAGIDVIKNLRSLHSLFIKGTRVTEEKVAELQDALPECHVQTR